MVKYRRTIMASSTLGSSSYEVHLVEELTVAKRQVPSQELRPKRPQGLAAETKGRSAGFY